MTTIAIRLHPAEVLNANQRMHWARKARLTSNLRARATIAWGQAGSPQMSRAHCTLTVTHPTGASAKSTTSSPPGKR